MSEGMVKSHKWGGKIQTFQCTQCLFQSRIEIEVKRHYVQRHGRAAKGAAKPVSRMTVAELELHADSLGIDRTAIEGSGSDGSVVKADLLEAIAAATG